MSALDNTCSRCGETFRNCYNQWSCDDNVKAAARRLPALWAEGIAMEAIVHAAIHDGKGTVPYGLAFTMGSYTIWFRRYWTPPVGVRP